MRPIWKGAISFGLVNIPIAVVPATSSREKISFRMLRKTDLSPIQFKRVAAVDGQEVPWGDIVKGYEYEKDHFVTFTDADFEDLPLTSAETIAIQEFVDLADIDPVFFETPYYIEPQKGGDSAYALLRDVLAESGKVGIAKVTLRNREHIAAVKASGTLLVLELMHFAHEITPQSEVKAPGGLQLGAREKAMARTLVDQMAGKWNPEAYQDEYAGAVMKLVEQKIKAGGKSTAAPKHKSAAATNVVDLVAVLQQSLKAAGKSSAASAPKKKKPSHRHAA